MIVTERNTTTGIVTHMCNEKLTIWEMLETYHQTVTSADFHMYPKTLWILLGANMDISAQQFDDLWPKVQTHAATFAANRKIAWVIGSHLGRSMIDHYWQSYHWNSQWQTFETIDDAMHWLAQPLNA